MTPVQVVLIVVAVIVLLMIIVANIELNMFLDPYGFWGRRLNLKKSMKPAEVPFKKKMDFKKKKINLEREWKRWFKSAPSEELWVTAEDGSRYHGKMFLNPKAKKSRWVMCVHGYKGNMESVARYAMNYYNNGYSVMIPELRNQGCSDGKYKGMGFQESKDLLLWIAEILSRDEKAQIVLHGESMGASSVLMATGRMDCENVKAVVSDSAFTSAWEEFKYGKRTFMHLHAFPMLYVCSFFSKLRFGFFFKEASCVKFLKRSETPTYFIHGADDKFVPVKMLYKNYAACSAPKDWFIFSGARHCQSVIVHDELYWTKVWEFIDRFVK